MRIDTDVLVIGSGAAGGVVAAELAAAGADVVLVERGGHYASTFFNQREWDMDVLYAGRGGRSTADGAIPVRGGECVGGGTTVNYTLCFDPVRAVWERWGREAGLTGFSFDADASDYGVANLNMTSSLAAVRRRINVHPVADGEVNDNNHLFAAGCARIGLSTRRFEVGMRDCLGCGHCGQGCAYDRKQGTLVTYVPDALASGARLVHHCTIERLTFARRTGGLRVTGARGHVAPTASGSQPNGVPPGSIDIRASLVVLCAGAVESASLLQRSDHPDPHSRLGRGLVLHPSLPVIGIMPERIVNYRGITGAVYSDHFADTHGFYLECLFGHPVHGSAVVPFTAGRHFEVMQKYARLLGFGVMLVDSVDDINRVAWHAPTGHSRIHYELSEADKGRMRFAAARAVEVALAAGATDVFLLSNETLPPLPLPWFTRPDEASYCHALQFAPHRTGITSAHCQGSVKMGEDVTRSVVNSRGESHHVDNLIVCDSSVFPSSCGVNPMISIMTMANYQARRIAAEPSRYRA